MSAFTPLDVRGPDMRRKQLLAKLTGQNTPGARGLTAAPPTPRTYPFQATPGRSFRNAGASGPPGVNITQLSNILPGILAKLGITGAAPGPSEHSAGRGIPTFRPIAPTPSHESGSPMAPAIPTPTPPHTLETPPTAPPPPPSAPAPPSSGTAPSGVPPALTQPYTGPAINPDLMNGTYTPPPNNFTGQQAGSPFPPVATQPYTGPAVNLNPGGAPVPGADSRYVQIAPNQWYDTLLDVVTGHR